VRLLCPDDVARLVLLTPQLDYKKRTIDNKHYWTDDYLDGEVA